MAATGETLGRTKGATYDDLAELIDRVAKNVANDYPDIDWEDVRQELVVFVLQNGKSIKLREDGGNPKWLLERVAQMYCKDQRAQHLTMSPQYAYKPSDVRKILEYAFDPNNYSQMEIPEDAKSPVESSIKTIAIQDENGQIQIIIQEPFHQAVSIELASDVKAALQRIKPELRDTIFRRYVLGQQPSNETYERKKLNKAVNELTYKLNTYRGFKDGRRKVMTNSASQASLSRVYDG